MDRFDDAFFREARSQIRALNDGLLAIENDDGDVTIDELFRAAHSLKGSCRTHGLPEAGELAHALEDVLGAIRSGEVGPTTAPIDEALTVVDCLEAVVRAHANGDDPQRDVDASLESLRSALEERRARTPSDADPSGGQSPDHDDEWNPADSELSDDVVAALEETTEFDDLDALLDDDGGESDDDLDGWGLLDEDPTAAPKGAEGVPDSAETPEKAEPADGAEPPDETETPDDPSAFFEETKSDLDDADAVDSLQEDIDAVEFGEFDDDDNYTIDELMDLDPGESPPQESSGAFGEREDATGIAGDDSRPGEFEVGDTTPREDVEEGPDGSATAPDRSRADRTDATPSIESADSDGVAEPDEVTASSAAGVSADEDAANEFVFGDSQATEPGPGFDDATSGAGESVTEATSETGSPTGGADGGEVAGSSESDEVPDPDSVPETDLDLELSGDLNVESGDPPGEAQMDVSVDEGMEEFESRFGDLLGGGAEGETARESPTFRAAVSTIEESRLDADDFPTAATADRPEGPDEFDRLQKMTVDVETADQLLNVAEELSLTHLRLDEAVGPETDDAITEEVANLLRVVTEYRRTVMDVRLMPLRTAVESIPRTVRDIARSQDKDVELVVEDADVELDRGIIDELRDPLVHVARNAVDHGIEPPEDRAAAGKPPEGTIEIRAERVDDRAIIEVSDDGRGIEPEAVRQRAVDRDVLTRKEASRLDDEAVYDLLFEPGFSTREEVTDVSGRGVGMDVVRRTVADLNGTVTVDSEPGEGTTVRLTVPVSIVFTEVLFVEANGETFGIPMSVVDQITATPPIRTESGRDVVRRSDLDTVGEFPDEEAEDSYPLLRLESALDLRPSAGGDDEGQVVWVQAEDERLALRCDRVVTSREVVVRPYGDLLRDVPGVSGATTLGDGEAVNVLDVGSI